MPSGGARNVKPTQLKVLQGTARRDRIRRDEPKPAVPERVMTPDELDDYGQLAWKRNLPKLRRMRLFTEADAEMLMIYCDAYSQWRHALDLLAAIPDWMESPEWLPQRVEMMRKANVSREKSRTDMRLIAGELGLSAAARSRLSVASKPADTDPMEGLLRGRDRTG